MGPIFLHAVAISLIVSFCASSRDSETASLSKAEEAVLRRAVYEGALLTHAPLDGPWAGQTIVVLPKQIEAIYSEKSSAVLVLFLRIVEGGRPQDCKLAIVYSVALASDPAKAVSYARLPVDAIDLVPKGEDETIRDRLVNVVKKSIGEIKNTKR